MQVSLALYKEKWLALTWNEGKRKDGRREKLRGSEGRKGNKWKAACQEGRERQQHREEPCLSFEAILALLPMRNTQGTWQCQAEGSAVLSQRQWSSVWACCRAPVPAPEPCLVRLEAAESQGLLQSGRSCCATKEALPAAALLDRLRTLPDWDT